MRYINYLFCYIGKVKVLLRVVIILMQYFLNMLAAIDGQAHGILVLIAWAISEASDEPVHPRSLARAFATRMQKEWM